jgi:hypothetical protein
VVESNYLRKNAREGDDIVGGPMLNDGGSYITGPVFRRWKLDGEYQPTKLYSRKVPGMIEAHDGEKPALAILLSDNLAFRIQKALVLGRNYRKSRKVALGKIRVLEAQQKIGGTSEFLRSNDAEIRMLENEIDEGAIEWARCRREADELLDMIWVKAAILAPRDDDLDGDEIEEREHVKKGGYQRFGEHADPEDMIAHLDEVATQAQNLIRARNRFDHYCHNYARWSREYVENQQKHDLRNTAEIQEEFGRVFVKEVALDRASVVAARTAYLDAQSRARDAGIPERCLGYVESIDIESEDSEEIRKADRSAMREVPRRLNRPHGYVIERELYLPVHRIRDWVNNVESAAPVPEEELDPELAPEPSPHRKRRSSQTSEHDRDMETNSLYGMCRQKSPGTREILAKSPPFHGPDQTPVSKFDLSHNKKQSDEDKDSSAASRVVQIPEEDPAPKISSNGAAAASAGRNVEPPQQQSGQAQRTISRPLARINESTERELPKQTHRGPVVNTWRPEAGIQFAKTGTKARPEAWQQLEDPPAKKGLGESRIDEVRRLLAQQRENVARQGKQPANAESKAIEKPEGRRIKTAGEKKRSSPETDSSAAKRMRAENRSDQRGVRHISR